jgi:hypothetical protein
MAFLLLPLWLALFPAALRLSGKLSRKAAIGCLAGSLAVAGAGVWWFQWHYGARPYFPSWAFHGRMPFLLNVLYDTGIGPVTLDPAYFGPSPLPTYPRIWMIVTILTALALVMAVLLFSAGLPRRLSVNDRLRPALAFFALSFVFIAGFEIVFSHIQEGGLFDRHLIIAAFPLCLAACVVGGTADSSTRSSLKIGCRTVALLVLVAGAGFSIGATRDYLEWNRLRWDLGNAALAAGANPLNISGGFEFNGWHNYELFRRRGHVETVFRWWYDTRDYLISMMPESGYRILRKESFFSWIHRREVPLYLLQRCGAP